MKLARNSAFALVVCLIVAGCGTKKTDVHGKVFLAEKNLAVGGVTIVTADSMSHAGKINDDGSFTVKAVPVGEAKIIVVSVNPALKPVIGRGKEGENNQKPDPNTVDPKWFAIPKEYGDFNKPLIFATIEANAGPVEIRLTAPPKEIKLSTSAK